MRQEKTGRVHVLDVAILGSRYHSCGGPLPTTEWISIEFSKVSLHSVKYLLENILYSFIPSKGIRYV